MNVHGNRRAGWLFIGRVWISWGPQLPTGRWSFRSGVASNQEDVPK